VLGDELGARRRSGLDRARNSVLRGARVALRARVEAAVAVAGREVENLEAGAEDLSGARARVEKSLVGFEAALRALTDQLRRDMFRKIDATFHPSGSPLADEVLGHVRQIEPPRDEMQVTEKKKLPRQMAKVYQEMRAAFHRYKVEAVNPRAVDHIRTVWGGVSRELAESARAPRDLLVQSVEAYRREARAFGLNPPELDLPELDPAIGRRTIALFSAITYAPGESAPDQILSFAAQWTRKLAVGWARRLTGKQEKEGFAASLLTDGAEAVRELLVEEARSNLLQYNEQVKYQVLGPSLEELARAWAEQYRDTVAALVVDLNQLAEGLRGEGAEREDLIPRLRGVLDALEPLAA
ncbi:MAG: hypothetical protein ACYDA8_01615, partial [Deferrisomatales bacterium]